MSMNKLMYKVQVAILAILAVFFMSSVARATTYHVDASNGNDGSSGTSQANAWETISKVNSSSFNPGDTILFKRGKVWREQLVVPSSGSDGSPITFGAYGSENKPVINGADLVTGWILDAGNVWKSSLSTKPYFVAFDGTVGTYKTSLGALQSPMDWYWDSNLLYCYSTSDPDTAFDTIETSKRDNCIVAYNKSYVIIDNLNLKYSNGYGNLAGVRLKWGSHNTVQNCDISYCMRHGINFQDSSYGKALNNTVHHVGNPTRTGYGIGIFIYEEGGSSDNAFIDNNTVHHVYRQDGIRCQGSNSIISNNTCYANRESGIELHYTAGTIVEYNKCYNNGLGATCGPSGISLWYGGDGNILRRNLCYDNYEESGTDGNGIIIDLTTAGNQKVYYNICYGNDGDGINVCESSNVYVYNNTCYDNNKDRYNTHTANPEKNAEISLVGMATDNCVIKNNVCFSVDTGYAISIDDGAYNGGHTFDYNCWFKESGNWGFFNTTAYSSVSEWRTATSQDANSINSDPKFISKTPSLLSNFKLKNGSLCKNAGTDVNLNKDFLGQKVPYGTAPDIGAIECYYIISPPQNLRVDIK